MFGRKPWLPLDALLGAPDEHLGEGSVEDWVQEHLQAPYKIAKQHLEGATTERVQQQPEGNAPLLTVGTVVYRRSHPQG